MDSIDSTNSLIKSCDGYYIEVGVEGIDSNDDTPMIQNPEAETSWYRLFFLNQGIKYIIYLNNYLFLLLIFIYF